MKKLLLATATIVLSACQHTSAPTAPVAGQAAAVKNAMLTAEASCEGDSSTMQVPITDLGGCYLSYGGGLYPNGLNTLPDPHLAAGLSAASSIMPLDVNGQPSANGKYVMLAIGMSNTTQEFCD